MGEKQVPMEKQVATIETEVVTFEERASAMVISTPEQNEEATEVLGILSDQAKSIEETRKFFTVPLNDQVKAINLKFMPQGKKIDAVIQIVKKKMGVYHCEQEEKQAKEQKRLDDIREKADAKREAKGEVAIEAPVRQVEEKQQTTVVGSKSTTVTKVWKFEITDINALPAQVRDAVFAEAVKKDLHSQVVRKFVGAGMREIEGVRIYQDTQISVR
jgi:hypothetical protein